MALINPPSSDAEMRQHRLDVAKIVALRESSSAYAPTDNDIPKLDEMCREYNAGKINLNQLVCRAWNGGFAEGASTLD